MLKKILVIVFLTIFSAIAATAYAAGALTDNEADNVIIVSNSLINDATIINTANKPKGLVKNTTSESKLHSANKSDSSFSTAWLFVMALFWFVILSNRRSV